MMAMMGNRQFIDNGGVKLELLFGLNEIATTVLAVGVGLAAAVASNDR